MSQGGQLPRYMEFVFFLTKIFKSTPHLVDNGKRIAGDLLHQSDRESFQLRSTESLLRPGKVKSQHRSTLVLHLLCSISAPASFRFHHDCPDPWEPLPRREDIFNPCTRAAQL